MADIQAPSDKELIVFKPKPAQPAPAATTGVIGWMRANLFSSIPNALLTFVMLYILYSIVSAFYGWGIERAVFEANTRRECLDQSPTGACWAGVQFWFIRFIYGRYPDSEIWRVNASWIIFALWMAPVWLPRVRAKMVIGLTAVLIYPFLASYLYGGGDDRTIFREVMVSLAIMTFITNWVHVLLCMTTGKGIGQVIISATGFADKNDKLHKYPLMAAGAVGFAISIFFVSSWTVPYVSDNLWGGMFLTLVISGVGIAAALPIGIVLALGRRSEMPVIRVICTAFIELFRSVPLITVLFMATTMFPLFLPAQLNPNKLVMVMTAVCLFSAAYMAETVRGGLQAINKGQYEAAAAMGLSYWPMMGLIIMPQALKLMIPNIVGSFIGLFKDTTLVAIIGLYDILGMIKAVSQDPQWIGLHHEPLITAAAMFFVGCFCMSKYSQHLERTLGAGDRR